MFLSFFMGSNTDFFFEKAYAKRKKEKGELRNSFYLFRQFSPLTVK